MIIIPNFIWGSLGEADSGAGAASFGPPGCGENGPGANGVYYDWYSGKYRNRSGKIVTYFEVYNNYVIPNSSTDRLYSHESSANGYSYGKMIDGFKLNGKIYEFSSPVPYNNYSSASGQEGSGWLDNIQTGIDVAGIADPTGIVDGVNALIYAGRGQWGNAGISALAIIPYIGDVGKSGRLGAKTLQLTSRARTAENGLELAGKFLKPGYTEIAPGVFRSSDQLRQFRMTTSDITGAHGPGPHFNFEIFSPLNLNKAATNYHVPIINP